MRKYPAFMHRLEAVCARLNDGLAAVAIVLAIVATLTAGEQRLPELASMLQPIDVETGISILSE